MSIWLIRTQFMSILMGLSNHSFLVLGEIFIFYMIQMSITPSNDNFYLCNLQNLMNHWRHFIFRNFVLQNASIWDVFWVNLISKRFYSWIYVPYYHGWTILIKLPPTYHNFSARVIHQLLHATASLTFPSNYYLIILLITLINHPKT